MPFKEIATLLKSSGIDLDHNRFLILQVATTACCSIVDTVNLFLARTYYIPSHLTFLYIFKGRSGTDCINETKGSYRTR